MGKPRVHISKEELERLYYKENRSASQLAILFNCSSVTVKNYLVKYGLRVKTQSEVMSGRKLTEEHKQKVIKTLKTGLKGKDNPNWKGGRSTKGRPNAKYILILVDGKYIAEHRYVMEQHLGRKLKTEEEVHHRNGNRQNNQLFNLVVMTKSEHAHEHGRDPMMRFQRSQAVKKARAEKFWSTRKKLT